MWNLWIWNGLNPKAVCNSRGWVVVIHSSLLNNVCHLYNDFPVFEIPRKVGKGFIVVLFFLVGLSE